MSPPPSTLGSVILLNGTSSAGKSTLAKAIQDVMDAPYLHLGIDLFFDALPQRYVARLAPDTAPPPQAYDGLVWVCSEPGGRGFRELRVGPVGQRLWSGMRHAAGALARRGNHVILDDVILDHEALVDYGGGARWRADPACRRHLFCGRARSPGGGARRSGAWVGRGLAPARGEACAALRRHG